MRRLLRPLMALPLLVALLGVAAQPAQALHKPLLADLNLGRGTWEMVAVSLHNHNIVDLQNQLGTFVLDNPEVLTDMQRDWAFRPMYEDYCDYHYILKFYQDKRLVKSLKVNLHCNYITDGVLSYHFAPEALTKHKAHFRRVSWAMRKYTDLAKLREAVDKLEQLPDVYFYQDVRPYRYDGYFTMKSDNLPWNVDRDSLIRATEGQLRAATGSNDFFVHPYIYYMVGEREISFRFQVFTSRQTGERYARHGQHLVTEWRPHLKTPGDFVLLTMVGISQRRYNQVVYGS